MTGPGLADRFAGRRVVVALSGGPDSAALAVLANRYAVAARAVHINHGTRASDELERAAAAVAGRLAMPFVVVKVEIAEGPGWEDRARIARYEALLERKDDAETLMTGHTADDQAETVVQHLLRGAGAAGLAGIPSRRGSIERPLLDVRRATLSNIAAGLPFIDDPSNADRAFERNRIRHDVMPLLAEQRPGLVENLGRTAKLMAGDDQFIEKSAAAVPIRRSDDGARVPLAVLEVQPRAIVARVLRRVLRELHPPYPGSYVDIDQALAVVSGDRSAAELGGGLVAFRSGGSLVVEPAGMPVPAPVALGVPARARFGAWILSSRIVTQRPPALPVSPRTVVFDADQVAASLVVRSLDPGDKIEMERGHKALPDAFAEVGVSARGRVRWPVVVSGGEVLWAPGVRRAALGWVSEATERYLWLDSTEEGSWTSNGS